MGATDTVELRGMVPRDIVDVIDAVAISRKLSRIDVVNEVLLAYVAERVHEATVISRITRGNPRLAEMAGGSAE